MTQSLYEEEHTSVASSCNENTGCFFTVPAYFSTQMNNELQLRNFQYNNLSTEQVSNYGTEKQFKKAYCRLWLREG